MPSTDTKPELTAKASMAQPVSQPAVYANRLIKFLHVSAHLNHYQGITQSVRASKFYAGKEYLNCKYKSDAKFKFRKILNVLRNVQVIINYGVALPSPISQSHSDVGLKYREQLLTPHGMSPII
jgi:hypothetical protein